MRSLIELPGLNVSSLASTVPLMTPWVIRLMRTIGVPPIASRMVSRIFFTNKVYTARRLTAETAERAEKNPSRRSPRAPFERAHMPRLIAAPAVGRRNQTEEDRRVRRPCELRPRGRERGAHDVAVRLAGARPAAGVRGDHRRAARDAARRTQRRCARRAGRSGGGDRARR